MLQSTVLYAMTFVMLLLPVPDSKKVSNLKQNEMKVLNNMKVDLHLPESSGKEKKKSASKLSREIRIDSIELKESALQIEEWMMHPEGWNNKTE